MYSVSKEYIAALRKPYRKDKIEGVIVIPGGVRVDVTDENIIRNKLSITRKVCGSSFSVGTFNAAELLIAIKDETAYEKNYNNARISLTYSIVIGTDEDGIETWESVPLGIFRVDGQQTTRIKDVVTLRGYDLTSRFDIDFVPASTVTTLWGLLQQACGRSGGIQLAITEEEFLTFPNADITPAITSKQIQSCRDVVMWVAQTTGSYAFIDRNGGLMLKRYDYKGGGMSEENGDRIIKAAERTRIEFSDTRTYLSYLSSYCGGKPKLYYKERSYETEDKDYFSAGSMTLRSNPLLESLLESEQDAINNAYLEDISMPTRYIKMEGWVDPAIDLLDPLGFTGGNIDLAGIISVATEIKWRYRALGTIVCNAVEEYEGESQTEAAAVSTYTASATSESEESVSSQVKPQIQKEIDAIKSQLDGVGEWENMTVRTPATSSDGFSIKSAIGSGEVYAGIDNGIGIKGGSAEFTATDYNGFHLQSGPYILNLNSTDGFKVYDNSGNGINIAARYGPKINVTEDKIEIASAYASITLSNSNGIEIKTNNGCAFTSNSNGIQIKNSGGTGDLYINGKKVLTE